MAGFSPVGSFPVASAPAGVAGVAYTIEPAELTVEGFGPSNTGTSLINPARIALVFVEVTTKPRTVAQIGLIYAEVVRTVSNGPTKVRVTTLWAEAVRTVRLGGRKRAAQIIG